MESDNNGSSESGSEIGVQRTRRPFPILRLSVVLAIAGVAIGWVQSRAPQWDHQNANLLSILVGMVSVVVMLVMIGRQQMSVNRGWRFVVLVGLGISALVGLVRFDGFSGEMLPQLKFRFARDKQPLSAGPINADAISDIDLSLPEAVAIADSTQFLGNNRNGLIAKREFAIPKSASEVKELWRIPLGEGWSSFAVSDDRVVTMEQRGEDECLTCYRLADGQPLWIDSHRARHENAMGGIGPRATPTIRDGKVFAQGATGWVVCRDLKTGNEGWTVDLLKLAGWDQTKSEVAAPWGRATSPLVVNDLCIVAFGGPAELASGINGRSLIALDVNTGEVVWTAGDDQLSYASPTLLTLDAFEQIVSVNESTITGHEIQTGRILWSFPWPGQSNGGANCTQVMAAGDHQFLIGKGYSGGSALVAVKRNERGEFEALSVWTSAKALKTKFTHALVDGGVAYALSDGTMQAVNVDDGEIRWRQPRMSRSGQGQAMLVEDVIVLQNEAGPIVFLAVDPNEYRELSQLDALDDRTWNIPTIAGRHLLVRNDHEAVCYLLPER